MAFGEKKQKNTAKRLTHTHNQEKPRLDGQTERSGKKIAAAALKEASLVPRVDGLILDGVCVGSRVLPRCLQCATLIWNAWQCFTAPVCFDYLSFISPPSPLKLIFEE